MGTQTPRNDLRLVARSIEEDLGFATLADVSSVLADVKDNAYRLIGGHMVTLHAHRWNLGFEFFRATNDADLGVVPVLAVQGDLEPALLKLGYVKTAGARFRRTVTDVPGAYLSTSTESKQSHDAIVDFLFPSYTSRPRNPRKHGDLVSIEIKGLSEALNRPAVVAELTLVRLNKQDVHARILLPDEADALVLKALAWEARKAPKDAVDVWRLLEIVSRAPLGPERFANGDALLARDVVRRDFARENSRGMLALGTGRSLNDVARVLLHTRVVALMDHVFGSPTRG